MAPPRRKLAKGLAKLSNQRQSTSESIVEGASELDDIVPIIGPTGAGKSSFINTYLGISSADVGHHLKSATVDVKHYIVKHPLDHRRRLLLVDTPGFDDTFSDDAEILRRIAFWLGRSYHDGMKLAGIIYLHEISQDRVTGTARKNLAMFKQLCGEKALRHVVLATTKWGRLTDEGVGNQRETELREIFWNVMLRHGSPITRFRDSSQSARDIVCDILKIKHSTDVNLRIQKELVDLQKYLPQTDAGKSLYSDLQRLLGRLKGELTQLRDMDKADQDDEWRQEHDEMQKRIQRIVSEIEQLKVPITQKILGLFGFH